MPTVTQTFAAAFSAVPTRRPCLEAVASKPETIREIARRKECL
jgi:hypothetical protein